MAAVCQGWELQLVSLDLVNARVLRPRGLEHDTLSFAGGFIAEEPVGRPVDLSGFLVLPGIVDLHGDAFERHLAPRRGAMKQMSEGLVATAAELAANGITTGVLAQFVSWEGGVRGPEFAEKVFEAIRDTAPTLDTDIRAQLRLEMHLLDLYEDLPDKLRDWSVDYVVFNDHLPHDRLAEGRRPPRLTGQALKAGRNPDAHFEMLLELHARRADVPAALDRLCGRLAERNVLMGSHDDNTAAERSAWNARGARLAEFPETAEAAEAARETGDTIILGAPNVVRGGSHKGNASAVELVAMGLCDALASDYHYPSPRRAALMLADSGVTDFAGAWSLVSHGPAKALGLHDRGTLDAGKRADIVILHEKTRRVAASLAGGSFTFLSGELGSRLFT
ncbi:alpha-D-ribose 1-methylphosphonate 5-triphosphate diphosphatase [uncultured Roseobacter sp.]|uniref:alpha-D-ribose 1-methylphosphonate 5-triphosphate diphosphatase n=1 Tax=uncultured Roseobacter sp. TaxID=114847 RepID=UPI0026053CF2|nr:alpha-D-ribose 1-methylphosphonate 5-triphosphate diphosphatase [uncultured Roseobacter sp.]